MSHSSQGNPSVTATLVLDTGRPYQLMLIGKDSGGQVIHVGQGMGEISIHLPASGIEGLIRGLEALMDRDAIQVQVQP